MSERFGRSDAELSAMPLPYAADLFAGKVAIVSGAGSGIGRATAIWLARLGASVVICGRDPEKLASAGATLAACGADVLEFPMSIRDHDAVAALFDAVCDRFGAADLLVNSAGGQFAQPAIDFSPKGWRAVIDTNLNGTWYMMQAAAQAWREAGKPGVIVNVATAITRGMPGVAHTAAARAGVIYASKTVAIEWAPLGIRINCVAPGVISSEGMNVYSDEARRSFTDSNPMRRFGQVEDVAAAILYLAGPTGHFITGEVLTVDGGNQMWGDQWTIPKPDYFKVS